jgi:hypothetical protein
VNVVHLLAIEDQRFSAMFLYCDTAGNLTDVWIASSDSGGSFEHEPASGSCTFDIARDPVRVELPALALPLPTLVPDVALIGPFIDYRGLEPGWAYLGPDKVALYPFAIVDCTLSCRDDGGWWELHALFYNEQKRQATVGVLYVDTDAPSVATLHYALSLPTLAMPENGRQYESSFRPPPLSRETSIPMLSGMDAPVVHSAALDGAAGLVPPVPRALHPGR